MPNIGYRNSGSCNSGSYNSGSYNSGNRNSGNRNSGYYNSGYYNSGSYNSGSYNSGNHNSGDYNSGNHNSGDNNSGHYNSGDCNSGYCNSGDYNSGYYNSGIFNTDEPYMRSFNKETNIKMSEYDNFPSYQHFNVSYWISEEKMTNKEKEDNPSYKTIGGFIKRVKYKEAWAIFWRRTTEENRQRFLALPNFDADIFLEITGIDVRKKEQEIDIDGACVFFL